MQSVRHRPPESGARCIRYYPTDGFPSYVVPPRVTDFEVPNLPAFQPTYFVVQAKDGAGNVDGAQCRRARDQGEIILDGINQAGVE